MSAGGPKALGFFTPEHKYGLKTGRGVSVGYQMRRAVLKNGRCCIAPKCYMQIHSLGVEESLASDIGR